MINEDINDCLRLAIMEEVNKRMGKNFECVNDLIDYAKNLEKENEQLRSINKKMECCKNCKKYRMLESQTTLKCLKNQRTNFRCDEWELAE